MIYKILSKNLCDALVNGAKMVVMSATGDFALVQADSPIPSVETHQDSELSTLMSLDEYKQPCVNCEL